MKAVLINKYGGPEVLKIKNIKLNDPKSGEVLIKNKAIGLNYIDTYHRSGLYPVQLPSNIGIEGAGIIEKILFHAAAGGVGQIFCHWARSLGCNVIGTVGSEEKIQIAKNNGCNYVINYSKENFAQKVKEFTGGLGVPVVYDGVGKKTFDDSIECLKLRGMMVSFGNASGPLDPCNVAKSLAPKGLYLTRPSIAHDTSTKDELDEAAKKVFEMYINKKFSLKIYKKYSLDEIVEAHQDLENRKILGPAVIIPS